MFDSRIFSISKDDPDAGVSQDAYAVDPAAGRAAIADGASSAIFSGSWARILVSAMTSDPPDAGSLHRWLAPRRLEWRQSLDLDSMKWYQKEKLSEGAFATVLWIQWEPSRLHDNTLTLRAHAVGDCCLLLPARFEPNSFPFTQTDDLQQDPHCLGSVDLGRDHLVECSTLQLECHRGDLLAMCTDALAAWAFRETEAGRCVDWERYWDCEPDAWRAEIRQLREQGEIRRDDTTLLLLRL